MNADCTLGLDLGTSSVKAVVIDTGGKVLSQASAGYAVTSAMAGYAESEPAHWWDAVTACTREAVHAEEIAGGFPKIRFAQNRTHRVRAGARRKFEERNAGQITGDAYTGKIR